MMHATRLLIVLAVVLANASFARAQSPAPAAPAATSAAPAAQAAAGNELSAYDRIWNNFTQWYRNDKNPVVQQVLFTGRFQHDFVTLNADEGDHDESNVRRVRLGPRITFLRNYLFHAEVEVNPQ